MFSLDFSDYQDASAKENDFLLITRLQVLNVRINTNLEEIELVVAEK